MSSLQKPGRFFSYSTASQRTQGVRRGSLSGSETDVSTTSNENLSTEERYVLRHMARQEPQGQENRLSVDSSSYNTLIIHGPGDDHWSPRHSSGTPPAQLKAAPPYHDNNVREITDIPDDYLSQSQVLKHLAKEVKAPELGRGPPTPVLNRLRHSVISKSQPDLSAVSLDTQTTLLRHSLANSRKDQQRCVQMVDLLMQENNNLKRELESCYQKVSKAEKLEGEVMKVHRAHEDLVASCERRERLERAARLRLQGELRRIQDYGGGGGGGSSGGGGGQDHASHGGQLAKREQLIAQLVTHNKELMAAKERQEIELAAQRATLQEQRTHIDILDTALINAQANVVRLEEECRKKQVHVERVAQLQRALSSLQLASDRREQTERKLRLQLERELHNERARNNSNQDTAEGGEGGESLPELKRDLREKDEKIMRLEGEVAKWEQRYLEESELRQAAIDAASIPKDAKIAALERTSQETEKLIAEARSDKIRQMDEVHTAQKRVTELEARMKELECKLAERDAMIRVLQKKHAYDKEVSSSYPSISLGHSPRPSLNTSDLSNVLNAEDLGPVSTTSVFSTVSSALTSSTGFGSSNSYAGSVDSYKYSSPNQSSYHKSLDDQLKELDSQLLSKRGLCCFPGFSHPGASSRKGKIPQPLLAGVAAGVGGAGGFLQGLVGAASNSRAADIALLEKQGLSSQQQRQEGGGGGRAGSLPPSSLPRPKRVKASALSKESRRLLGQYQGEYGRLDGSDGALSPPVQRDSSSPCRKPGEYGRLSSSDSGRKTSANSSTDTTDNLSLDTPTRKQSPVRSMLPIAPEYAKRRESPNRSLLPPPPRKLSDYSCYEVHPPPPHPRLLPPTRRGSLHRDQPQGQKQGGVRSLPTPNKYRIQF